VEREQLRDLVRCREDIRVDLMRARHRIGKFLLRREIYWEGPGEAWTRKHRSWLTSVRFADQASRATMADYLHAHDLLIARRDQVEGRAGSGDPGQGLRLGARRQVGRFDRWASTRQTQARHDPAQRAR